MSMQIPAELLPNDGRFGSGPSKVPDGWLDSLAATGRTLMGTSHRQAPIKNLVREVIDGLDELFGLPDGYEIAIGNGGSTAFWDIATYALIEQRSQHAVFGEFGGKFAKAAHAAPWLGNPTVITAEPGTRAVNKFEADVDAYAWTHNETSTGVWAPVVRPEGATADQLTLVDATSAAGGLDFDVTASDVYYFAPQKSFASDGGLWFTTMSPAAIERAERIKASGRHIPAFFDLVSALKNTRKDQTLNTPAVASLYLMARTIEWMLANGGLAGMAARTSASATALYSWAEASEYAAPFVDNPEYRSDVVGTIELDASIDKKLVMSILVDNGIVDLGSYRGIGANQLRVAMYPAVDAADVEKLTACIDYVVERL